MAEFKCISCGEVKESEKECICPVCGYKMFETPYERAEVLRKEIREFIAQHRLNEIPLDSFDIFRKVLKEGRTEADGEEFDIIHMSEDNARFPGFLKIREYICSSEKTEIFHERVNNSLEQIRKHIHEP